MYYDHSTCMYYDHSTCMHYVHSTCMYYDHSTYVYYDHSTYVYYDHSTCEYFLLEGRDWRVELIQIRRVGGRRTPDQHYSPFSNNSPNFIWLGGVRSDPPLPNKKPVFYLAGGGCSVERMQIGGGSNAPSTLQPPQPNKKPVFYLAGGGQNEPPPAK